MLSVIDISELWMKKRKEQILEKHDHEIWQGTGNDKRWFTYVADDLKPKGRRKIAKISEEDLYDYLEDFYFGEGSMGGACLLDVYPKWLEYKIPPGMKIRSKNLKISMRLSDYL